MLTTEYDYGINEPRMQDAIAELKALIRAEYPDAVFEVFPSSNVAGIYMRIIVDADDPDDATALIQDRFVEMQLDEDLPIYPVTIRTAERRRADPLARHSVVSPPPEPTDAHDAPR